MSDRHFANREINDESQPNRTSAENGLEEKDYEFDIEFFEEIVPEVRVPSLICVSCLLATDYRELWLTSTLCASPGIFETPDLSRIHPGPS